MSGHAPDDRRAFCASAAAWLVAPSLIGAAAAARAADKLEPTALARPGRILLLRHALAPGVGDPDGFRLRVCSTQRNLNAAGRAQASELGQRLRAAGVRPAAVLSSQWCRCLETARLLQLGPVTEEPALNSFFGRSEVREPQLDRLRERIAGLPADGPPVVMVTHQVVVTAFSGGFIDSGAGAVFQLDGTGSPRLVGML